MLNHHHNCDRKTQYIVAQILVALCEVRVRIRVSYRMRRIHQNDLFSFSVIECSEPAVIFAQIVPLSFQAFFKTLFL